MAKRSVPVEIPGLDVAKAKRYSRTRLAVLLAGTGWSVARMAWFALSGRSARLRRTMDDAVPDPRLAGPAYLAAASLLSWASSLPVAYFGGHRVERRFGLTKQSDAGWLADQAKGLALGLALQTPLSAAAFAVIRRRPRDWWLILSGATVPLLVLVSNLAPVLIAPIFNRFEPLADRDLAERVRALAAKAGVPIADVFRMDMSRQTEKPNAFFTGLGNTKRIVLADTLIDRFEPEEVDGVVAHELGHQVHGDIWRLIALGSGMGLGGAWAVSRLASPLVRRTRGRHGAVPHPTVARPHSMLFEPLTVRVGSSRGAQASAGTSPITAVPKNQRFSISGGKERGARALGRDPRAPTVRAPTGSLSRPRRERRRRTSRISRARRRTPWRPAEAPSSG
jgi:STE24 endopeptidase